MATMQIPVPAGGTIMLSGRSIDGFNASAPGTITITRQEQQTVVVPRVIPVKAGWNSISQPIGANRDPGNATISCSAGMSGTVTVVGVIGQQLSQTPVGALTFAQLPDPTKTPAGTRATITDASVAYASAAVGSAAAGGGANVAPVFNNGASWIIG